MTSKWLTLGELAAHSRLSTRTLKRVIARDGSERLPSYLIEGRRLVRAEDYEGWAERHKAKPSPQVVAAQVLARLRKAPKAA
jgi:hypothetical protein